MWSTRCRLRWPTHSALTVAQRERDRGQSGGGAWTGNGESAAHRKKWGTPESPNARATRASGGLGRSKGVIADCAALRWAVSQRPFHCHRSRSGGRLRRTQGASSSQAHRPTDVTRPTQGPPAMRLTFRPRHRERGWTVLVWTTGSTDGHDRHVQMTSAKLLTLRIPYVSSIPI